MPVEQFGRFHLFLELSTTDKRLVSGVRVGTSKMIETNGDAL